jgi:hypothetical protein
MEITKPEALASQDSVQEVKIENPEGVLKKNQELLAELKNTRIQLKKFEEEKKSENEKKLMDQQEYSKLVELKQKETDEWKSKFDLQQKHIEDAQKLGAFRKELVKLGIGAEYMDNVTKFVDVNSITYDQETGTITGADLAAKTIF